MHPAAVVRAAVDTYVAMRQRIEDGEATWIDLSGFFTDDAVYVDPAWVHPTASEPAPVGSRP